MGANSAPSVVSSVEKVPELRLELDSRARPSSLWPPPALGFQAWPWEFPGQVCSARRLDCY